MASSMETFAFYFTTNWFFINPGVFFSLSLIRTYYKIFLLISLVQCNHEPCRNSSKTLFCCSISYASICVSRATFSSHSRHLLLITYAVYIFDCFKPNYLVFLLLLSLLTTTKVSPPSQQHHRHVLFKHTWLHAHRRNADRKLESIFIEIPWFNISLL